MNLLELSDEVRKIVNDDTHMSLQEVSAIIATTDPNRVRWTIEDEDERSTWEDVIILTAAAKFMEESK